MAAVRRVGERTRSVGQLAFNNENKTRNRRGGGRDVDAVRADWLSNGSRIIELDQPSLCRGRQNKTTMSEQRHCISEMKDPKLHVCVATFL